MSPNTRYPMLVIVSLLTGLLTVAPPPVAAAPVVEAHGPVVMDTLEHIRPGDVIRLRVWREPDFSGEFSVSEAGITVFPRIGAVEVEGMTEEALRAKVVSELGAYLNHSSIELTVLRRVQVLGAVRSPGLYPVDATMTIGDVIALAGGSTVEGRRDRVQLIRDGDTVVGQLDGGTRLGNSTVRSGDQLYVPERSWLSRNSALVGAGISASISIFIAVLTR